MSTRLKLRLFCIRHVAVFAACAVSLSGCGGQEATTASATPAATNIIYSVKFLDSRGATVGAHGFNNRGQVVGAREDPVCGCGEVRAAIWDGRNATEWSTFGQTLSIAFAINDAGQIVGRAALPSGIRPVIWHGNTATDLGTLGGGSGVAYSINKYGHIAGYSTTANEETNYATVWRDGQIINLGALPGGNFSTARAINDGGDVVGSSSEGGETRFHATLWADGKAYKLGTPSGGVSEANALNNHRQAVGYSDISVFHTSPRAMLWENGMMQDLGTLGGRIAAATGINDAGQIVGYSTDASEQQQRGVLWYRGRITDLTTLLAPEAQGITITYATAINDIGEILAIGVIPGAPDGVGVVLLTPQQRK
jgi:probable HAF family extracellular repeat protein